MTDSELLSKSREILSGGYGGTSRELAYFAANYLDDSPVTEEALLAMVSQYPDELMLEPDNVLVIRHTTYWFHFPQRGFIELWNDFVTEGEPVISMIGSMSTLRCLLRGLGVGCE